MNVPMPSLRSAMQANTPKKLIDALLSFAMDPTMWEVLAAELGQRADWIETIDPASYMTLLSQAETLAWQLRGDVAPESEPNCIFVLLDRELNVLQASNNIGHAPALIVRNGAPLEFTSALSEEAFTQGLAKLREPNAQQVLVELHSDHANTRYGYLVEAENLPATFIQREPNARFGLLLAEAEPTANVARVLQSSFQLTTAETSVAQRLASGLPLKDVAASLAISTNTARNHLQAAFDKTGLNRQGELILMITQLSVILSVISRTEEPTEQLPSHYVAPPHQFFLRANASGIAPRRMAYRTYGDGPKQVMYFHESSGCSRLPPQTEDCARELGLTIIATERPGTGFSDPLPGYDFTDIASDHTALADQLHLNNVTLIGYISGAAHALAVAARLDSRVSHVILVAGRGAAGYGSDESTAMAMLRRQLTRQPWLLSTVFNIVRTRATVENNKRLLQQIYGVVDHDRRLYETRPDILEHMATYTLEGMTVSAAGIVGELTCHAEPKQLEFSNIAAPITAWHGSADAISDLGLLRSSLTGLQVNERIFPDHGSLLIYEYWEELLTLAAGCRED